MTKELLCIQNIDLNSKDNKVDALLSHLMNLIITHKLPPNYVFPNENEICSLLSIGRGTLREVYKVLESYGYISRSKSGTRINDTMQIAEKGSFDKSLLISKYEKIIEFLLIVEPEAAKLAAKKIQPNELEKIRDIMMKLEKFNSQKNFTKVVEFNAYFHQCIRDACHNPILVSSIYASRRVYEQSIILPLINDTKESIEFMELCLVQHYNLYYALRTGNGEEAFKITYNHFLTDLDYCQNLKKAKEKTSSTYNQNSNTAVKNSKPLNI